VLPVEGGARENNPSYRFHLYRQEVQQPETVRPRLGLCPLGSSKPAGPLGMDHSMKVPGKRCRLVGAGWT
jgi:hypothetical protein